MPHKFYWLLMIGGIVGCTVGPDYQKIEPTAPNRWQAGQTLGTGLKPASPEALKTWWERFGDAHLNSLMDRALKGNLDIKIALTRIGQARAERKGTRAELFPKVNVGVGAQRQDNPFPGLASGIRYNLFDIGFDALWEIDLFGRQLRRLEAASADLEGEIEQYRQSLVILTAELARSYVEYRSLQNQLHITRANLKSQQQTLSLTKRRYAEGVGTRHNVVRARAQTEITQSQIPALEAQQIAALRQLEVLIGEQPGMLDVELNSLETMPTAPGIELLSSPSETIRHRPDLRAAERQLAAATAMQGAAIAELFPKISISAFLGLRNNDIDTLFKSAAFSYGTAANLIQPLLNFGRIRAGINLAEARQKEAYLAYKKAVLQALQETETALTHYLKEEIRRQQLALAVADLRESVRLSQLRFNEGVIAFLDVLDAQRILYVAEIDLSRSEARSSTNLIAVYKALGGGMNAKPLQPEDNK